MAYDQQTYGDSPFGPPTAPADAATAKPSGRRRRTRSAADHTEALSDHGENAVGPPPRSVLPQPAKDTEENSAENGDSRPSPALPDSYAPALKAKAGAVSALYLPKGRITGLNLVGEGLGWLMAWGTVGFFRAYVPPPILLCFDSQFTPWGMAGGTLLSALVIGQLLRRYEIKIGALKSLATTAIEYGESHHRADTQNNIYELLTEAEESTQKASAWVTSWLIALVSLFIIGAFY